MKYLYFFAVLLCLPLGSLHAQSGGQCYPAVQEIPAERRAALCAAAELGSESVFCCNGTVELEEFDPGTWARTTPIRATDEQGNSADMRLYVLDSRFAWEFDSATQLKDGANNVRIRDIFERPLFLNELCAADAAIAIGAASFEGDADYNARLAGGRAQHVTRQLDVVGNLCEDASGPPLYAVNLGEFRDETPCSDGDSCRVNTATQRGLVIVAAEKATEGLDYESAIKSSLRSPQLKSVLTVEDYSLLEVLAYSGT